MKNISVFCLLAMTVFFMKPSRGECCSCAWKGPFLMVAREAPLVIRGKILRHHPGPKPIMDVLVLETLAGGILDSGLAVQMGDGMHRRPLLGGFPPDSEWILALNGPGAKPGSGWALSHCGEFWLRVDHGDVVGSIDGDQRQLQRMPLGEFRDRFRYPRFNEKYSGSILSGAGRAVSAEDVARVEKFGRGILTIEKFALAPGENGCPKIQWLEFSVQLEGGY